MLFIFLKISNKNVAIWIDFNAMTVLVVRLEVAFIYFVLIVDENAFTESDIALHSSEVNLVAVLDKAHLVDLFIHYFLDVDVGIGEGLVLNEVVAQLLLVFIEEVFNVSQLVAHLQPQQLMIHYGLVRAPNSRVGFAVVN